MGKSFREILEEKYNQKLENERKVLKTKTHDTNQITEEDDLKERCEALSRLKLLRKVRPRR